MKAAYFSIKILVVLITLGTGPAQSAGIICLYDSTSIQIKTNLTAVVSYYKDFEITSEEGLSYADIAVPVNDYIEFRGLKGHTELPNGKKLKIDKKSFVTLTGRHDREFGGKKAVLISLKSPTVGAKIHYEYRLHVKSLLYLPKIAHDNNYPVKRMAVRIDWNRKVNLNFDHFGFNKTESERSANFFAEDLPEVVNEPYSCGDDLFLYISADRLKFDKKKYKSESWQDVGTFFSKLSQQPGGTFIELEKLANKLLAPATNKTDSLELLFEFVADSVSYVSLRIGSGDFKPHWCEKILERRFGDCKDQSILLSSLYQAVGIESYPALIATGAYPHLNELSPWPSFFDHAIVVIPTADNTIILDPSDPYSSVEVIPLRLRGKYYLSIDGISDLKLVPEDPVPSEGLTWRFNIEVDSGGGVISDFMLAYINDAAVKNYGNYHSLERPQREEQIKSILQNSGWKLSSIQIADEQLTADSLKFSGSITVKPSDIDPSGSLAIGSPLLSFLLENVFNSIREGAYCRLGSIHLEEFARVKNLEIKSRDLQEYRDYWVREGLEFYDEMKYINGDIIFRRVFEFAGTEITRDDYNAFRNFLLSRKNQRYVYLHE